MVSVTRSLSSICSSSLIFFSLVKSLCFFPSHIPCKDYFTVFPPLKWRSVILISLSILFPEISKEYYLTRGLSALCSASL